MYLCICMKKFLWIVMIVAVGIVLCSRSEQHRLILTEAGSMAALYPDSALKMLDIIDPADLDEDSLKAAYALAMATAHKAAKSSMVSDSLTGYAFDYYRNKDFEKFLQAGDLYALHRFWLGEGDAALALLDSLIALPDVPLNSKIELLRSRIGVGGQLVDGIRNIAALRQLMQIDTVKDKQLKYKRQLYLNYTFVGKNDSALVLLDELIEDAYRRKLTNLQFEYQYEKVSVLEEAGRYSESNQLADYIIDNAPENSALHFLHFCKALNFLNLGEFKKASEQLAVADKYVAEVSPEERQYYESLAGHIRNILDFHNEGRIKIISVAELSNKQRDRWFRDNNTRYEQKQNALKAENRALEFKAQSERKTYIIVIISLVAFIIALGGIWLFQKRKRKMVETEERADTLQKMVDELRKLAAPSDSQEALRRAMLQQLNIIKMVAETPTEQNREMLRKISSLDSNADGPLVNWANMYEIIDSLYSGFHSKLHSSYGDKLSEKEEQVIMLLAADFSAKEISVITSQSTASVYVRKSSAKKKLGVPEKQDVIAFLRGELSR